MYQLKVKLMLSSNYFSFIRISSTISFYSWKIHHLMIIENLSNIHFIPFVERVTNTAAWQWYEHPIILSFLPNLQEGYMSALCRTDYFRKIVLETNLNILYKYSSKFSRWSFYHSHGYLKLPNMMNIQDGLYNKNTKLWLPMIHNHFQFSNWFDNIAIFSLS